MALNTITIEFEPCNPAPSNGYVVKYRPVGSTDPYRTWPANFFSSPAVIEDDNDDFGTSYEGIIQGDCGDGVLGVEVPWSAANDDAPSPGGEPGESGSAPGGGSVPMYNYECEVYSCLNCAEPAGTIVAAHTNPSLPLFKYYQAEFGGNVVYRPIGPSAGVAADNMIGLVWDTCLLACSAPPPIDP